MFLIPNIKNHSFFISMQELAEYFSPIDLGKVDVASITELNTLFHVVDIYKEENKFPVLENIELAIIGVPEDRGSVSNSGCADAADYVRNKLYRLFQKNYSYKIADLGNLKRGHSLNDTYIALSDICGTLLKQNTIPIIIGGSQDLSYSQYLSYQSINQIINVVTVDAAFDLGDSEQPISSQNYLSKIVLHQPNHLFNLSNIGYQTYFVGHESIQLMEKLYFDVYRLGQVRANMEEVEPIVRNADMLSFDVSAIRQSDAPGNKNASPNGFYGEEACQIVRYAGLSDNLTSIGFYETNQEVDNNEQTVHLVSQMIWYFIDSYYNRKKDLPVINTADFLKYRVSIKNTEHEIIFYKSKKSDRWWMGIPSVKSEAKYERHHIIPCSYSDYQIACKDEMPARWWQIFQKLN